MIGISVGRFDEELNVMRCKNELGKKPSWELTNLVADILEENAGEKIKPSVLAIKDKSDDLFLYTAAYEIIKERHGEEYVFRLTGVKTRDPKTFREKMRYWITGEKPVYNLRKEIY